MKRKEIHKYLMRGEELKYGNSHNLLCIDYKPLSGHFRIWMNGRGDFNPKLPKYIVTRKTFLSAHRELEKLILKHNLKRE